MSYVTPGLLAGIRGTVRAFLTDTCDINNEVEAIDDFGSPTHATVNVASGVPCRIIKAGQFNTEAGELVGSQDAIGEIYKLIVPHTVTLDINYSVQIHGISYRIVRLETELTDEAFHTALIARTRGVMGA